MRLVRHAAAIAVAWARSGAPAAAQPAVDAALRRLRAVGRQTLSGWRFRLGDLEGGAAVALDDSGWKTVSPKHRWRGENQNAWYRRWVTIPDRLAGFAVAGSRVTLKIGVDDGGETWANGRKRCDFGWAGGEVPPAGKARRGDALLAAIPARTPGGPGRPVGAPRRAVSYPANPWEYGNRRAHAGLSYFFPVTDDMIGKPIEAIVLQFESADKRRKVELGQLKPEVWITAYPVPYVSKELVLEE